MMNFLAAFTPAFQRRLLAAVERRAGLVPADLDAGKGPILTSLAQAQSWVSRLVAAFELLAKASVGSVTLVAGVGTVADTSVTANTRIFTQREAAGGTVGVEYVVAVTPGTGFTITSIVAAGTTQTADTSTLIYQRVELPTTVATPTASVGTGTYNNDQSVTTATATSGAYVRYTLDGTDPTRTNGLRYAGVPIAIKKTTVVKFRGFKDGATDSAVLTRTYTITAATPAASPAAGTYAGTQSVALTTATVGATIRYTTNGVDPTPTTGTLYTGAISIAASATLKAIAVKQDYTTSAVLSAAYTIT